MNDGVSYIVNCSVLHVDIRVCAAVLQVELAEVAGVARVKRLERAADHESRLDNYKEDEALRKRNAEAVEAGGCAGVWACVCAHHVPVFT